VRVRTTTRDVRARLWLLPAAGALGALVACGGGGPMTPPPTMATPTPPPPNFIVIQTDDLEAHGIQRMPKLENLLTRQGTRFANAFVTTPLCGPSRASLFSGAYAHNHGMLSNGPPFGGFQAWYAAGRDQSALAPWLKAAGYRTALVGKYLNNYPATAPSETYIPPGWDEWQGLMLDRRAELAIYTMNEQGSLRNYRGNEPDGYQTDVIATKAADFIRRSESNDTQPFFLYVGVSAPHVPAEPAARHEGALGRLTLPKGASFNEDDVSDKPGFVQRTRQFTSEQIEDMDADYTERQRTLLAVDDLVEGLVTALDQTGELANTFIVFTSDNGIFQGEHRQTGKSAAYDEAIRVTMIIRGPGVPIGRSLDQIVSNIDLAPTFLELARVPERTDVDGRSLVPLFAATPPTGAAWRRDLVIEYLGGSGGAESEDGIVRAEGLQTQLVRGMPDYNALRTETHTYVEYVSDEKELYDLVRDGQQLDNLMQRGGDPALAAQLATRLSAIKNCRGAACRQ
jgi:N-acetylglucosamine-6-sulfatase